jgi:hypothetical protein
LSDEEQAAIDEALAEDVPGFGGGSSGGGGAPPIDEIQTDDPPGGSGGSGAGSSRGGSDGGDVPPPVGDIQTDDPPGGSGGGGDTAPSSRTEQLMEQNRRDTGRVDEVADDLDRAVDDAADAVDTLRETGQQDVSRTARDIVTGVTGVSLPTERELARELRRGAGTPNVAEFTRRNRERAQAAIGFLEANQALSPGLESPSGEFEATTGPPPGFAGLAGGGINAPRAAVQTIQRARGARGLSSIDEALRAGTVADEAARGAAGSGGSAAGNIIETTTRGQLVRDAAAVGGAGAGTALSQDGELPVSERDSSELPVSEGGRGSEIGIPDAPAGQQGEIAVPEQLDRGQELPVPDDRAVVMASLNPQQIGRGRQRQREREDPLNIPDEFIPDDDVTIGDEADRGPSVGRPDEQPQPTSPGSNPRFNRRRQRREQFLDRGRVGVDSGEASEPEVTEPEADLPSSDGLAADVAVPDGLTDIGPFVAGRERDGATPAQQQPPGQVQPPDTGPDTTPPEIGPVLTPEIVQAPSLSIPALETATQTATSTQTATPPETATPTLTRTVTEPAQPAVTPPTLPDAPGRPPRVRLPFADEEDDDERVQPPQFTGDRAVTAALDQQELALGGADEAAVGGYDRALEDVYGDE